MLSVTVYKPVPLRTIQNHSNLSQMTSEVCYWPYLVWGFFLWQWDSTDTLQTITAPLHIQTYKHALHTQALCNWTHCHLCLTQALCCQEPAKEIKGGAGKKTMFVVFAHTHIPNTRFKVRTPSFMTLPKDTVTCVLNRFYLLYHFSICVCMCLCQTLSAHFLQY